MISCNTCQFVVLSLHDFRGVFLLVIFFILIDVKTLKSSESDLQHVYSATTASVSLATSIADMATDMAMEGNIVVVLKTSSCI